ncbi:hypothetical protein OJAV_G00204290 [Oryzias javanicus]|uniref:Claudin n=1 Tax=Oryzias javanicus TaxID=123683 RepID=A0A3S2P5N1_ORYJA|nr:hypothetical protein OJAV_G00204290 [Oryzias javanicus]
MFQEIVAFVVAASGWILESSTLATDYWKVSSNDGSVITTSNFWSSLWKNCVTDSTGVSNCRDFPSMLALEDYIQACRGLMISAVCLGFFGCVFALVGMKCTKIGGSDQSKAKTTCFAGVNFVLGGLCSISACSLYAHRITSEFFNPFILDQKYELGAALFIGWAGGRPLYSGRLRSLLFHRINFFQKPQSGEHRLQRSCLSFPHHLHHKSTSGKPAAVCSQQQRLQGAVF